MMRLGDYDFLEWFGANEFTQPLQMDREFLQRLDQARANAGVPFKITSSFREDPDSTHGLGVAVDIALPKDGHCRERWLIIMGAKRAGFSRIGIYDRHIHLDSGDRIDSSTYPPECIWWGKSK